jgi:hypothetical protein
MCKFSLQFRKVANTFVSMIINSMYLYLVIELIELSRSYVFVHVLYFIDEIMLVQFLIN